MWNHGTTTTVSKKGITALGWFSRIFYGTAQYITGRLNGRPVWGMKRMAEVDPLLALLRRYRAERQAFDDAGATAGMTNEDWDRIAEATWWGTQTKIIESEPSATTAAGALLALDHVLQSDDLFAERSESVDLQLLWLLTRAARHYIASLALARANDNDKVSPTGIEGARAPRRRSFDIAGRLAAFASGFAPKTLAYAALAGTLAIVAQGAVLTEWAVKNQTGNGFGLASSSEGPAIMVRFSPDATASEITSFLAAYKAQLIAGPGNFYQIRIPGLKSANEIAAAVGKMQSDSKVVDFVAARGLN
jgi:hypothetical protein